MKLIGTGITDGWLSKCSLFLPLASHLFLLVYRLHKPLKRAPA